MLDPIKPPAARRPEEALDLVSEALSDGDLEAALAQYESSALLASWPGRTTHADFDVRGILESFMALRLPLAVRIVTVLQTPDLALVICQRRVAGTGPDDEPVRLFGQGCAVVRLHQDGSWRIAADTWQAAAEPSAECWLSRLPEPGTTVRWE
jgi:ketosteroid isomerase-like protein